MISDKNTLACERLIKQNGWRQLQLIDSMIFFATVYILRKYPRIIIAGFSCSNV